MICETLVFRNGTWSVGAGFPDVDSERTLVLVFGTPGCTDDPRPLLELSAAYPRARFLGCSTAGEIAGREISDHSVVAAVCRFESTRVEVASAPVTGSGDSGLAGFDIAGQLVAPDLRGVLIFCDGLQVNGSELLRGVRQRLPPSVLVTGGLAADEGRFERTWTIQDRQPRPGWVSAVGLYGDQVQLQHTCRGGWEPFGPQRLVTRSHANVLFDIDRHPALDLYEQYLGELRDGLPATALLFPLGVSPAGQGAGSVVRTMLSIDRQAGSMTFAGDIPQGSRVQLMRASLDHLVAGARAAADQLSMRRPRGGGLAIAVSCVSRRLLMGERAEDEVEAMAGALPAGSKLVGYYAYGELSSAPEGTPDLQNQTMTLTHLCE
jgi:hypothetical protein